jgi:hypothetical protein
VAKLLALGAFRRNLAAEVPMPRVDAKPAIRWPDDA